MNEIGMLWAYCPGEVIGYGAIMVAASVIMVICIMAWIGGIDG